MEVLYTRREWRYRIHGEDRGIVYKEGMEVLSTQEDDEGIVHYYVDTIYF